MEQRRRSGPRSPEKYYQWRTPGSVWTRAAQVAGIIARYGFSEAVHSVGLGRLLQRKETGQAKETEDLAGPARLRLALEEIGPTGVKIGQALATRPDLLPPDYVKELRKLQDAVPPFSFEAAQAVLEEELGEPLGAMFAEFDPQPVAAASLSQVHRARRHNGRWVAVKVQRPEVRKQIEQDLGILSFVAREAQRYSDWARENDVVGWAAEFAHILRSELNFAHEANNMDRMREELAANTVILVPRTHRDLTTSRILTMDYVEGVSPNDAEAMDELGVDRATLAKQFVTSMFEQVTGRGFFHADPHGGNLLVQTDGRIALLDFGHVDFAGRELREYVVQLLGSLVEGDSRGVVNVMVAIGAVSSRTNMSALRLDVDKTVARYAPSGFSPYAFSEAVDALMGLLVKHGIRVPATFASLLRAIVITQGVSLQLDPNFDSWAFTADTMRQESFQRLAPHHLFATLQSSAREWTHYLRVLPRQVSDLLLRAQAGGTQVRIQWENADRHLHRLDIMVNRLSFAVVVAAIIVASANMLCSVHASEVIGSPFVTVFAAVGALMGLWLLYSVIRSGRL